MPSPAIQQAIADHVCDQEKHRIRLPPLNVGDAFDSSEDEKDNAFDPTSQFQKATGKVALVQRLCFPTGIRNRHLLQFGTFNQKFAVRSQEHELFLARILNYAPLMAKLCHILHKFRVPLFGASEQWDRSGIFNLVTGSLHDVKKITAHVAWFEHVKPLRAELAESRLKYNLLRTQMKDVRSAYLKEVSALRDSVRVRGDPLAAVAPGMSLDVTWFYEPTDALEPEERKYLLDMMREKFKMMVENNPTVVRTFDFGQIEKLMEKVESHEITQLREALKSQREENYNLRQASSGAGAAHISKKFASTLKDTDSLVNGLFQQLEEARGRKDDLQHSYQALSKQAECFEQERDELASELRSVSTERAMLLTECENLRVRLDEYSEINKELEVAKENATDALRDQEAKMKSMEETLQRMNHQRKTYESKSKLSAKSSLSNDDGTNTEKLPPKGGYGTGSNPLPPLEADAAAGKRAHPPTQSVVDLTFDSEDYLRKFDSEVFLKRNPPAGSSKRESSKRGQNHSNDEQTKEVHFLRKMCANFQKLLGTHLQVECSSQSETAAEEAENLALLAGSLGADQAVDVDIPDGVRVCRCGNLMMEDSKFCRKCGQEWDTDQSQTRRQVIAKLSLKLGDVAAQLEEAIKQLDVELEHSKDPKRAHLLEEAERNVTRLKREQKGYETQLLAERTMDSFQEVETMAHLEMCTCNCFKELEVSKDMLRQLRSLCVEMAAKIKQATADNVQLNAALDSTLVSLDSAKNFICRGMSMKGPDKDHDLSMGLAALAEAEHKCVFHRLFNPTSPTKKKWKEKRLKLMQDSMKAIENYVVLDQGYSDKSSPGAEAITKKRASGDHLVKVDEKEFSKNQHEELDLTIKGTNTIKGSRDPSPETQENLRDSDDPPGTNSMSQRGASGEHAPPRLRGLQERGGDSYEGASAQLFIKSMPLSSYGDSPSLSLTAPSLTGSAGLGSNNFFQASSPSARSQGDPVLGRSISGASSGITDVESLVVVGEDLPITATASCPHPNSEASSGRRSGNRSATTSRLPAMSGRKPISSSQSLQRRGSDSRRSSGERQASPASARGNRSAEVSLAIQATGSITKATYNTL